MSLLDTLLPRPVPIPAGARLVRPLGDYEAQVSIVRAPSSYERVKRCRQRRVAAGLTQRGTKRKAQ